MELEVVHKIALWGFCGGVVFGVVGNHTQFCAMGSVSDWVNIGVKTRFRAWMLAIGIALVTTQTMATLGWIDLRQSIYLSTNFNWLGYVLGGLAFGVGMSLASGCGHRTLVRIGGGNLKSLVVFLVMGITAYMTLRGLLALVRIEVVAATGVDLEQRQLLDQSLATVISHWTGISDTVLLPVLVAVIGLGTAYFAFKDSEFRQDKDNMLAAICIGLLVAGAWYVTGVIGNDDFDPVPLESLTFIAPSGNTINYLMTYTGATINFGIAIVLGVVTGSLLYALATRGFRIESFASRGDLIAHLLGAVLMGFGGVLALGCTIGQGVTGMSTLATGSLLALVSIIFGSALTIKMQYYLLDGGFATALRSSLADLRLLPKRTARDE